MSRAHIRYMDMGALPAHIGFTSNPRAFAACGNTTSENDDSAHESRPAMSLGAMVDQVIAPREGAVSNPSAGNSAAVACHGKARFTSYGNAERKAKRMGREGADVRLCAYHCSHCGSFHVGNRAGRVIRRPRRRLEILGDE